MYMNNLMNFDDFTLNEKNKPSEGLTKEKKSDIVKRARRGEDIGKKGKNFEQLNRSDIDPYGEEDWNDDNDTPIIQLAKEQNKPLDQIMSLYCYYNSLTSLEGIEHLTNLETLNCSYNSLTNLEGIEHLTNLELLDCSRNQLTNLEGIEHLTNLRELYCHSNQLTNLDGIEHLTNLRELYCSNNELTSLEGIEHLTNLETLYCFNNKFSSEYKKYLKPLNIENKKI